jgi:pimeloyl-ACP methyl ester carboxylesterase
MRAMKSGFARATANVELLKLANCRHSPHRDQPEAVLEAAATWTSRWHSGRSSNEHQ